MVVVCGCRVVVPGNGKYVGSLGSILDRGRKVAPRAAHRALVEFGEFQRGRFLKTFTRNAGAPRLGAATQAVDDVGCCFVDL